MFLPLFPREIFEDAIKFFNGISSNFCDSNVVDDKELESPKVLEDSFLEEVNLDLHLDVLLFPGGAIEGTVLLLGSDDSGSNDTVDTECSRDWLPPCAFNAGDSGEHMSPGVVVGLSGGSDDVPEVSM